MNFRIVASLFLFACTIAGTAQAGSIQLGAPTVESGVYELPITLSGGNGQVSAMDFRIQYDPAVFRPVTVAAGPMALQANKQVIGNGPTPGEYVVIMHGINQNTVGNGDVATVRFERIDGGEGASRLDIVEPTLAGIDGDELPVSSSGRTVGRADDSDSGNTPGTGGGVPGDDGASDEPAPEPATPVASDTPGDTPVPVVAGMNPGVLPIPGNASAASAAPENIVIPRPARPEPGNNPTTAAERGAGARLVAGTIAGAGDAPSSSNDTLNRDITNRSENSLVEDSDRNDARITVGRLDSGSGPIESVNGRTISDQEPAAAGLLRQVPTRVYAIFAACVLIAAIAMMGARHKFFR